MKCRCPICNKTCGENPKENKFYPFCSERCKLIDLGKWLDSEYKVSTPIAGPNPQKAEKGTN